MAEEPTIRIPRDIVAMIIGFTVGAIIACVLMLGIFERWRPLVLEWRVTKVNMGTWVRADESPKSIQWRGIIYDCVKSEDQGTPYSEASE